jgi:hypothetical protein
MVNKVVLQNLLAFKLVFHAFIGTEEKLSIEQLYSDHSKNEMEEEINDQNVEHVF